jgi:hypothetical protein
MNGLAPMEMLSIDQVKVRPYSSSGISNGVVTFTIPNTISEKDNGVIRDAADDAVNKLNLSGNIDHTMLCIPSGTTGGWIGYAYYNWYLSVYNDNWCLYPSIQMHEIGHNWDLYHSSQGDNEYGDQSGMMGYSYSSDSTKMCFNAPKNRQLGWYSDKTRRVTSEWSGRLYGLSSYKSAGTNDAVILYIPAGTNGFEDDYYISFNGASGINSGTKEGANKVLVHKRSSGTGRAYSYLDRQISSGFSYTDAALEITVSTISGSTYAQVTIGNAAPSPTPPVTCQDSPLGWYDSDGPDYNCGWYSLGDNCAKHGDSYSGQGGKTANEACCACGGGTTSNDPSPPTPSPTQSPTKAPTEPPIISDSPCSTDFGLLFKWNSTTTVTCDWVKESPSTRCYKRKAKSVCPNACSSTAFWCNRDGRGKFQLAASQNTMKGCAWVKRNPDAVAKRCSKGQVALVCRGTCEGL